MCAVSLAPAALKLIPGLVAVRPAGAKTTTGQWINRAGANDGRLPAWTTPDLVKRWWSGQRGEVTIAEIDLRVGGAWRYVMTANAGFEVGFHGEDREIVPEERIVYTEVFEGMPDAGGTLNTATFTEIDGHTMLTLLSRVPESGGPRWDHRRGDGRSGCRNRWTLWSRLPSRLAE